MLHIFGCANATLGIKGANFVSKTKLGSLIHQVEEQAKG